MVKKENQKPKLKFFISYCDRDGLQFVKDATAILEKNGHQAWYFDRDKTLGVLRIEDISEHIRHWCNKMLYICTDGSISSEGQRKEIGQWDNTNIQLIVIPIVRASVPISIDTYIYKRMNRFDEEFKEFVIDRLEEHVKNWEELNHTIVVTST